MPPADADARDGPLRGAWAAGLALLLCAGAASADGGRLRLRQDAGPFTVSVFTAPEPLTAGAADVSVLVQDRSNADVLLDAEVEIVLAAPGNASERSVPARPGSNRLFQSATVRLTAPGDWRFGVVVRRGAETARIAGTFRVEPAPPAWTGVWPFLIGPPLGVALFGLGRILRRGRSRLRSA
jgi:hypothetical protein